MSDDTAVIGILGGSFNPVHIGHLMVAKYLVEFTSLSEVWLTLSPLNPLKAHSLELIPDLHRLEMLKIATRELPGVGVCDLELSLPRPSYTITTLEALHKRYPRRRFKPIVGSDNLRIFEQWRSYDRILEEYGLIVYPRPGYPLPTVLDLNVQTVNAPLTSLSSTFLRKAIATGKDVDIFMPPGVSDYIKANGLYQLTRINSDDK